jgi:uncharacterized protein (DUF2126 family)
MPAYEDTFYYLWKERRLPVNVDPLDSKLEDPVERSAWPVFRGRLGQIDRLRASAAPHRHEAREIPRWTSQPWFLATGNIFLIPGDSPIGYRLPLESLPWTKPEDVLYSFEPDPFAKRDVLPARPARSRNFSPRRPRLTIRSRRRIAQSRRRKASPRRGLRAPRFASRRATASCSSLCRRWNTSRIIWIWWPRSKTRPLISTCR